MCCLYVFFTCGHFSVCATYVSVFISPANEVWSGIYSFHPVLLSVCLSVWLPSVDMILSTHVLGNGSIDFSENLYTNYLSFEDVHLEFSYSLIIFFHFKSFFLYLDLLVWNSVLKIMQNFDLNIENVLFLNWHFVFTIMIYNIFNEICLFEFWKFTGGGGWSNTLCRFNKVEMYCAHFWFSLIYLSLIK